LALASIKSWDVFPMPCGMHKHCVTRSMLSSAEAKLLADLPDRRAFQRGICIFLKELQKTPPDTVLVNYSGHGMQKGGTVYMLPRDADLEDTTCEPDVGFLPIRDIFKWCHEDLDMLARMLNQPRPVRSPLSS